MSCNVCVSLLDVADEISNFGYLASQYIGCFTSQTHCNNNATLSHKAAFVEENKQKTKNPQTSKSELCQISVRPLTKI